MLLTPILSYSYLLIQRTPGDRPFIVFYDLVLGLVLARTESHSCVISIVFDSDFLWLFGDYFYRTARHCHLYLWPLNVLLRPVFLFLFPRTWSLSGELIAKTQADFFIRVGPGSHLSKHVAAYSVLFACDYRAARGLLSRLARLWKPRKSSENIRGSEYGPMYHAAARSESMHS